MIAEWRREIDELNREILQLLNLRAELALRIAREKRAQRLPLRSPAREEEVIRRLVEDNRGPLGARAVERIFRLIIAETRRIQEQGGERK